MTIETKLDFGLKSVRTLALCHFADVVEVTFPGGHRHAKGVALLQSIVDGDATRLVTTAQVACASHDEALALIEAIGCQRA